MNIKTLTACALLALSSTTALAESDLPQMNMTPDMIEKAQAESSATSAGNVPFILFILFAIAAASIASGSDAGGDAMEEVVDEVFTELTPL